MRLTFDASLAPERLHPYSVSMRIASKAVVLIAVTPLLAGCSLLDPEPSPTVTVQAMATATPDPEPGPVVTITAEPEVDDKYARPLWLGQIPLEVQSDGLGERKPTPEELQDRQFEPRPWLPDPESAEYVATIEDVPADVLMRSSWEPNCPVHIDELSYLTMTYWGFDQKPHTGEMLIHSEHAEDVTEVFRKIYEARFPIEEMRVISRAERDEPPTGDHNITSGYTCRQIVGAVQKWSQHSMGLAIDINPFHNPFYRGEELYPELSESYKDRDWERVGMIYEPSVVFDAFEEIGWKWGGHWHGREDWMHFSAEGG